MIHGLVFDLDDTLYFERDYVRGGFAHIATLTGRAEPEVRALSDWLAQAFDAGVRDDTFDRLLAAFPGIAERFSIRDLIEAYRSHRPAIRLAPGVEPTLDTLRAGGLRLAVLSDGPLGSQAAKAEALGLDRWFDPILFTAALGPDASKPATAGFEAIAREWGIPHGELAYVADNPAKDFAGPRLLGWLTVRLRRPEQLRFGLEPASPAFRAELEIALPDDLVRVLRLADGG